jgi:hypothetical protein
MTYGTGETAEAARPAGKPPFYEAHKESGLPLKLVVLTGYGPWLQRPLPALRDLAGNYRPGPILSERQVLVHIASPSAVHRPGKC